MAVKRVVPVLALLLGAGLFLLLARAPAATSVVDFETGPPIGQPINDEYRASASVYWQRSDPRFRPYRRVSEVPTHSGTIAADVGPDHCFPGEEDSPCELATPGTFARLTRPATAVSLYAGLFQASPQPVSATLTVFNAANVPVGSMTVPIGVGITTPISVSRPAGDITSFELFAPGSDGLGAYLGFDDLSIQFPDAPPPPRGCFGGSTNPTGGVRVSSAAQLNDLLRNESFHGTVIVPRGANWAMKGHDGKWLSRIPLNSGVRLIGERGPLGSRPTLFTNFRPPYKKEGEPDFWLFEVVGNDVQIEGLHIQGPWPASTHKRHWIPYTHGIRVFTNAETRTGRDVLITDNEFDEWGGSAVDLQGFHPSERLRDWKPAWPHLIPRDAGLVKITRNYMHHNAMDGGGYGVAVAGNSFATIDGNVFDFNRHAIAAGGKAHSGYVARFNYVLEGGYKAHSNNAPDHYNQHFDVHGELKSGYGGFAGTYFLIGENTFRGEQEFYGGFRTRPAFMLRGKPSRGAFFNNNVVVHDDIDEAVQLKPGKIIRFGDYSGQLNFHAHGNRFDTDQSAELATGNFDEDACADVFVANGTAWFYSRAGASPWQFLRPSGHRTRDLGFADIDNDGFTDVLSRTSSGQIGYHMRARSGFIRLTTAPVEMKELRFGDFDGDGKTDIFYTRGGRWRIWYGTTRAWRHVGGSSFPLSELLFGEFDDTPGTDVAGVTRNGWSYSRGATMPWTRMNNKITNSFAAAVAADFDGNGRTDIAVGERGTWRYSAGGRAPLRVLRGGVPQAPVPLRHLEIARFDGPRTAALGVVGKYLMVWRGLGGVDRFFVQSRQPMR